MPAFDLFSKRRKMELVQTPDIYCYDVIPKNLRVQIIQIWWDAIGNERTKDQKGAISTSYYMIVGVLRREYGVFSLVGGIDDLFDRKTAMGELIRFFTQEDDVDRIMDVIEVTFRFIDRLTRDKDYLNRSSASEIADVAIEELNLRFRESGVGYHYSDGRIIRIDSEFVHNEAVVPALLVLRQKEFESASREFMSAHKHYREGEFAKCLEKCLKTFKAVMQVICSRRNWAYEKNKPASHLIDVCFAHGLMPDHCRHQFDSLTNFLESGVPMTCQNKSALVGGVTRGATPTAALVRFALHMTASTVLFLAETDGVTPG